MCKLGALLGLLCSVAGAMPNLKQMQQEAQAENGEIWALLVAGSNGWYNYRHQADICHSYHILSAHGIPDDHIVVMMYDDIAENSQNPTKGTIINKPYGTNVYPGTPKDYVGRDVTPENFLKIMQGEDMTGVGSGKTLHSGPNDRVFVYFADHGGTGIIAFPMGLLHADDLNSALKSMHAANKFSQLVFYMEACESGSMFNELLPTDINVYAMTASNPGESSWGCYCSNPEHLPCLGDLFSVKWMEDSDKEVLKTETLEKQYELVKSGTNKSHVMQYGDLSITKEPVADFQGLKTPPTAPAEATQQADLSPVESRDIYMHYLKQKYELSSNQAQQEQILKDINWMKQKRAYVDNVVGWIVNALVPHQSFGTLPSVLMSQHPTTFSQVQCHKAAVLNFSQNCFELSQNPYAMKYSFVLSNLCEMGLQTETIVSTIENVCSNLSDKPNDVQ